MSVDSRDAERDGVAAAEAQRSESACAFGPAWRRGASSDASAARANRMSQRDRAAIHVDAIPTPVESCPVRERLRRESLVGLDQIVVANRVPLFFMRF